MISTTALLALVGTVSAEVIWDGRANDYADNSFLDEWSFSNPVGPYQYYIHGEGSTSDYVNLDSSYKNPADTGSAQGIQITNDKTSSWNGQTMLRTELIPQTDAAINAGKVFYHFSMQTTATNPPDATGEHQINFFESHFTEMKYGLVSGASGTSSNLLQWFVGGESQWNTELVADTWHNVAYGIDFDAGTVEFYHSTGYDALEQVGDAVTASTSSNGADWHLGVLRLTNDGSAEDWHFSGVYIEDGDITTSVVSPGGSAEAASSVASSSQVSATSSASVVSSASSVASSFSVVSSASSVASSASVVSSASSSAATVVRATSAASSATEAASTTSVPSSTEVASSATEAASTAGTLSSSSVEPERSCQVEYVYV